MLTLVMAIGLLPGMCLPGYADTAVTYLDANGKQHSCTNYTVVENDTPFNNEWYVANHDVTINNQSEFSGAVHLILCDGVTLTFKQGISYPDNANHSLTIYAQSTGVNMGMLIAEINFDGNVICMNKV